MPEQPGLDGGLVKGGTPNDDVLTKSGARSPLGHGPTSPYVRMPAFNDSLAKALSLDPFFRFATDPPTLPTPRRPRTRASRSHTFWCSTPTGSRSVTHAALAASEFVGV